MGYPAKVQLIKRQKGADQWYINFPSAVAAYAMLLLAAEQCRQRNVPIHHLPTPKWRQKPARRVTTMDLINNLRHELWAQSIHFSGFVNNAPKNTKPQKCDPTLQNALFYASSYT